MKIRARPRKKSSRRSRGWGGTAEPSNPDRLAKTLHRNEGNNSVAGRRWSKPHRRSVVIPCGPVTDQIYSDTLSNAAGKNLDLTFSKEPAPPALCLQARPGVAVNDASV